MSRLTNVWWQHTVSLTIAAIIQRPSLWSLSSRTALKRGLCYNPTKGGLRHFVSCQSRILGVRWYDFVPNTVIAQHRPGQSTQLNLQDTSGDLRTHSTSSWNYCSSHCPEDGRRHTLRPYTWQRNSMEVTSRAATAHLDATARRRHWTQRWQSVEYCQWPWSLDATTHRWTSGLVSECVRQLKSPGVSLSPSPNPKKYGLKCHYEFKTRATQVCEIDINLHKRFRLVGATKTVWVLKSD